MSKSSFCPKHTDRSLRGDSYTQMDHARPSLDPAQSEVRKLAYRRQLVGRQGQSDVVFKDLVPSILSTQTTGWPYVSETGKRDKLLEGMLGKCNFLFRLLTFASNARVKGHKVGLCVRALSTPFRKIHAADGIFAENEANYAVELAMRSSRLWLWAERRFRTMSICVQRRHGTIVDQVSSTKTLSFTVFGRRSFNSQWRAHAPLSDGVATKCSSSVPFSLKIHKSCSSSLRVFVAALFVMGGIATWSSPVLKR